MRDKNLKAFLVFAAAYIGLLIWLKPWNGFFSDSLLKIHESYSLVVSGLHSELLWYPGKAIDPNYEFFFGRVDIHLSPQRGLSEFSRFSCRCYIFH